MFSLPSRHFHRLIALPLLALLAGTSPGAAQGALPEPEVARQVREALSHDPHIPADRIGVTGMGGVITLEGSVDSVYVRERASRIARQFVAVLAVNNDILVHSGGAETPR